MRDHAMLIDGHDVATDERDDVYDPAVGQPFAQCPRASGAHVDEAVAAAQRALAGWRDDESLRRDKLAACAAAVKARAEDIGAVLCQEQGKPLKAAIGEVRSAANWLAYFASLPTPVEVVQDDDDKRIVIVRKPLGVVAAITPWNFPVVLLAWKLAPALLAGNTVVAKPSPYTPLSTLALAQALKDILPRGVLNVLAGGNEIGEALCRHPDVRKVSFTGSIATGKKIMATAAPDLKRLTLELGGNDPAIVLPDVDPDAVAAKLFWSAFANSGQVCVAVKRLYLHEQVHDRIVDALGRLAREARVGPGSDAKTQLGPLNNAMQRDKVAELVDDARARGARIAAGGTRPDGPGYFYPPTIVTDAAPGMRLVDEEQFGTAMPVLRWRDLDDAIEQANRTHFGLGASVWTSDRERGEAVVQRLDAGNGWVNHHADITTYAPFGGTKWSGIGAEGGRWGYAEYTSMQVVNVKKS